MNLNKLEIIELCSEAGAGTRGASLGAKSLVAHSQSTKSYLFKDIKWAKSAEQNHLIGLDLTTKEALNHKLVTKALEDATKTCAAKLEEDKELLILSGDHSNGAAGVASFTNKYGVGESAVIWIDAHADLHTPFTTPSGNMHGMPLAAMLGIDNEKNKINELDPEVMNSWSKIKKLGNGSSPKLLSQHLVFISIRDLEEQEWKLVKEHNIKYFSPEDIKTKGIEGVLMEVDEYLKDIPHWYTSFDVDSMDPSISKGTGTPVPKGLSKEEALTCFGYFFEHEKTKCFEVTEINPLLDKENAMAKFVHELLEGVLK